MKWKLWFDEQTKLVRVKVFSALTKEEAETLMSDIENLIEEKGILRGIMDLSESEAITNLSKEVRDVYKKHAMTLPLDKAAIIVTSPAIRMIAKIVIKTLGKSTSARFFASEKEALEWLKEEK